MDVVASVKNLGLPELQFVVIGSGPLVVLGIIPEASDVDMAVSPELYTVLSKSGWKRSDDEHGKSMLQHGDFEAGIGYGEWSLEDLLSDAFFIDGIPFASIDKVLLWKKSKGRVKDVKHIQLIETYLKNH